MGRARTSSASWAEGIAVAAAAACVALACTGAVGAARAAEPEPSPAAAAATPRAAAPGDAPAAAAAAPRQPCQRRDPLRQPLFGDLHVHTALSLDAATQGTRTRPRQAYRFARGEPLGIPPFDRAGKAMRHLRLARPLDFAAVTDHAELFGELEICTDPTLGGYDSALCRIHRRWPRLSFFLMNYRSAAADGRGRFRFCGPEGEGCIAAARTPWREVQDAAEEAYDRTPACTFTTFVGYEWTASPDGNNLHRNVLFASDAVPERPISAFEATTPEALWKSLGEQCRDGLPGCDFVVIPHNSNLSGGLMFRTSGGEGRPLDAAGAAARAAAEPLVEVMQHKGSSECRPGAGTEDELCAYELLPYDSFAGKYASWMAKPPQASNYVREALSQGLLVEERTGVNPFRFGLVGSTDTHLGAAGAVSERGYPGHGGAGAPVTGEGPAGFADDVQLNPGGLAVVWAEENSRESIFAALRRREVYATSGPRLVVRLFGGFDLPSDACTSGALVETGYARGVPMGGVLAPPPGGGDGALPSFAVWAVRDPGVEGDPGALLSRVQIVKRWVEGGETRERVVDVAGDREGRARVDAETCETSGPGFDELCAVWTDAEYRPEQRAVYYARVLEVPTCRWTARACRDAGVRCSDPASVRPAFAGCCDGSVELSAQERAWTSPIWISPVAESPPAAPAPAGALTPPAAGK